MGSLRVMRRMPTYTEKNMAERTGFEHYPINLFLKSFLFT